MWPRKETIYSRGKSRLQQIEVEVSHHLPQRPTPDGSEESPYEQLPEPWVEKTDPASGRSYYINPETRVTTRQRPPAAANSSLSDVWVEKTDPASGRRHLCQP